MSKNHLWRTVQNLSYCSISSLIWVCTLCFRVILVILNCLANIKVLLALHILADIYINSENQIWRSHNHRDILVWFIKENETHILPRHNHVRQALYCMIRYHWFILSPSFILTCFWFGELILTKNMIRNLLFMEIQSEAVNITTCKLLWQHLRC